jgi:exosortase B
MSTVLVEHGARHGAWRSGRPWALVTAGLALLYVPTYAELARTLWRDDAYAHGPIVLGVFLWLAWRSRGELLGIVPSPAPVAGSLLFASGLALYLVGRTQSLPVFEVASHIPVIAGLLLLLVGHRGVRTLAFPLLFLAFLIPLPGFVMDAVTVPLKSLVSMAVEAILDLGGYPVERSGVVLTVDGHDMLVADACSGLNSIFSLFALALLYTHVTRPHRPLRTALLLAGIVPIAILANIVRVTILVLITHHLGEDAAQGFLHGFAGMVMFVSAFILLLAYDWAIGKMDTRHETRGPSSAQSLQDANQGHHLAPASRDSSPLPLASRVSRPFALAFLAMALTASATPFLRPVPTATSLDLESTIPATFGDWHLDTEDAAVAPSPDVAANLSRLYRQIVSRTYVNSAGERVMLMVAYGGDQSDALKAHRQEACYAAQGFAIRGLEHVRLPVAGRSIPVTRMHAIRGERSEPVTYWFTMGDRVVLGRAERLKVQLENGLAGRIPDGMLVRVSNLTGEARGAYATHRSFIAALVAALAPADATRFVGAPRN